MTAADYFFADERLSIVTCDEEGAIRMYEYDPQSKRMSIVTFPSYNLPLINFFFFVSPLRSRVEQRTKAAVSNGIPRPIGLSFLRDDRTSDERRGHGRAPSQTDMR